MKITHRIIGGREYRVLGSTTETEKGMVVHQSFTTYGGKVVIENGKVTHPDGTVTDIHGGSIPSEKSQ